MSVLSFSLPWATTWLPSYVLRPERRIQYSQFRLLSRSVIKHYSICAISIAFRGSYLYSLTDQLLEI
ncbi:hypothetical protein METBIDRAFT_32840 [Metschnikowia bicuspidata var. bicuspidata NRRL YB-4993]|uniref:Uncharacterized protein n=1 Tax=Metschnikowia bicuspidata var. bicuspidata NRRL YB-4993 TaxID=869754 RepID=A0A1A0H6W4_9ASCO|nr:hypothetical protein METBIDRAFT_32840 [Metschnikowia bicuspidata var. bicuspidata NRRL YB-4993]OBA19771.1 hypothetical protein METBIDRAFT_32840 [Metschnikowia bicuspidata var. bicuspidata NRRL YB-4993]